MWKILIVVFILFSISCNKTLPFEPSDSSLEIITNYGTPLVFPQGHSFNASEAILALNRGYLRAITQRPEVKRVSLDGLKIIIWEKVPTGGNPYGVYIEGEDSIHNRSNWESNLEHENMHRLAWMLGIRGACFIYQDHSPGYDLNCNRR